MKGHIYTHTPLGTVYLVGAGHGAPDLLTLRAHRLLQSADVVLHDLLIPAELLETISGPRLECVGKRGYGPQVPQDYTHRRMVELAREGLNVVRLKCGDPYVFGRGSEEAAYLASHDVPYQVVPGISSALASSTSAQVPLTHRGMSQLFSVITGHTIAGEEVQAVPTLLRLGGTVVVLMGVRAAPRVETLRNESARPQDEPPHTNEKGYDSKRETTLVPGAPLSAITLPTTRYVGERALPPNAVAADHSSVRPAHNHAPLVWFLTLSQLAFGVATLCLFATLTGWLDLYGSATKVAMLAASVAGFGALGASTMHLGQPLRAWRVILGVGHSWLSREVVAIGAFVHVLALATAALWLPLPDVFARFTPHLLALTVVLGCLGVFTSAMLYIDTKKDLWISRRTFPRFILSSIVLGTAVTLVALTLQGTLATSSADLSSPLTRTLLYVIGGSMFLSLLLDVEVLRFDANDQVHPMSGAARVMKSSLRGVAIARLWLAGGGGFFLPLIIATSLAASEATAPSRSLLWLSLAALTALFGAELLGRRIFFQAAVSRRMPGERR